MNLSSTTLLKTLPLDEDLAEQAQPGHGIPSQDPQAAAQFSLSPDEAAREASSIFMGGGLVAGAATGAALGVAVAGPVGVLVGATAGAVVGALGGAAAGTMVNPEDSNSADVARTDPVRLRTAGSASRGEPTAQVHKLIAASPTEIWTVLTMPAAINQFLLGANVVTNWEVGSPIRMKGTFAGETFEDKGNIVTFDPPRQLSFSHWSARSGQADAPANYHIVTFDLVREDKATRVTLSQANLMGVTAWDIGHRADYEKNWNAVLDRLAKLF